MIQGTQSELLQNQQNLHLSSSVFLPHFWIFSNFYKILQLNFYRKFFFVSSCSPYHGPSFMVQDFFLVIILDGAWLSRDLRPASDDDMLAGRALTASRLQSGSIIGPRSLYRHQQAYQLLGTAHDAQKYQCDVTCDFSHFYISTHGWNPLKQKLKYFSKKVRKVQGG